jgi:hypothetical protein
VLSPFGGFALFLLLTGDEELEFYLFVVDEDNGGLGQPIGPAVWTS